MKNILILTSLLLMFSCNSTQNIFQENDKDWELYGDANWNYLNHELIGKSTNEAGFVLTKNSFTDFVLELEFKPDSTINSGVFIRCKNTTINPTDCYELNIWDLHPDQNNRTGAMVTRAVPLAYVETINKWNTFKVVVKKNHIRVWINNIVTVNTHNNELTSGYIGLQAKGSGEVRFRNIKIKSLNSN
jgi:hypothetical protein